ncbi:MAG: hypothetical protein V1724_08725 [Chloroflexota bacterium]
MALDVRKVFDYCFQAIGGDGNDDVRWYRYERPERLTRKEFFDQAVYAIWVGGKTRVNANSFLDRREVSPLVGDFETVANMGSSMFQTVVARIHGRPVPGQALARWQAVRFIAKRLDGFGNDRNFCKEIFQGKSATKDLNDSDLKALIERELPWIRTANAQLILRNLGGEFIKCDRWLTEFMAYGHMPLPTLEREVRALGIPLGLFDLTIWAYCEKFVKEVSNLKSHFDSLSTRHGFRV